MEVYKKRQNTNRKANFLSELLRNEKFLNELCSYSNYDLDTCFDNICKLINYYLNSNDFSIAENIETLFYKIEQFNISENNYIFYPTSSYFKTKIKLFGLFLKHHPKKFINDLEKVENQVSVNKIRKAKFNETFLDLKSALTRALSYPTILYNSILKVPFHQIETPYNSEYIYYQSILNKRLTNIPEEERKTATRKVKKWFNAFINHQPLLVIFSNPQNNSLSTIPNYIFPSQLSYIELPTRYTIQKICDKNKPLPKKENIPSPTTKHYVIYSRYEQLPINTEFIYTNEEFTGDIDYDVDLIYGALDYNGNRKKITSSPHRNLLNIKKTHDIIVREQNGKYIIKNGRHRLLYVKNFYVQHYKFYRQHNALSYLKKLVTLTVNVEHLIEDEKINKILKELHNKYDANFIKYNINDDKPDLLILINEKVYVIHNIFELTELYQLLNSHEFNNKYYLSNYTEYIDYDYNELMSYLIITLQEKIYTMNLLDIVKYLLENGFFIKNTFYKPQSLNYYMLYNKYTSLCKQIKLCQINNQQLTIVENEIINTKLKEIGQVIINIIESNSEYIKMDWDVLLTILKQNPFLKDYDSETLSKAANKCGYQALKYNSIMKENTDIKHKIW